MKISKETSVLITGGGSGIGRSLALDFAKEGASITVVDFSEKNGKETVRLLEEQAKNNGRAPTSKPVAFFVQCNVASSEQLSTAFAEHLRVFGHLDICVNNAGVGDKQWFIDDKTTDGTGLWRDVININLVAVIDGTRLAVRAMQAKRQPGVVINVASAAGLYPSPNGPVYSASKGGVVLFTRSLGHLSRYGVRVNALCPEYVETPLISQVSGQAAKYLPVVVKALGGYITMDKIIDGVRELIEDDSKAGDCLWITNRLGKQYWPTEEEKERYLVPDDPTYRPRKKEGAKGMPPQQKVQDLPKENRKMIVHKISPQFRQATHIVTVPLKLPVPKDSVLIKYLYAGVNASDVNYTAGRYFGSASAAVKQLPFDAGFEGVGVVVAIGEGVTQHRVGSPVATLSYGSFSEYHQVEAKMAIPVEAPKPEVVALLTSGLTASIALEQAGRMGSGETVLVTAAAGGTGHFAVQLAKIAGNRVVATCGGPEKAEMLKRLGVDRVIDYKAENLREVLKKEYPNGVDVIYESVGGEMFQTCMNALARFGRCVVIGMMSQYTAGEKNEWATAQYPGLAEKLLWKSQTLTGFFLPHYTSHWKRHLAKLYSLYKAGHLHVAIDPAKFTGLESVADAVEYLHSGKSVGKVIIRIAEPLDASKGQSRL